ncbi:MAG: ZIP family metal transporter [Candidatus Aenigmarchaeota archaeon]|nr:ZIP family metal transporter [Candidatus Aenigmarchaeota archaeon]
MFTLLLIILATFINGLIALVGAFSLFLKEKQLNRVIMVLVAFSAGALLSGGMIHLLAESIEMMDMEYAFIVLLSGFSMFFVLERFLHWHHCHKGHCDVHAFSYLILIGDGIHNFIDGLIIAASFIIGIPFGVITTMLIIGHEIPQELGDFGILVYGGIKKNKALLYNFASQLTSMIGGVIGFFVAGIGNATPVLLSFAAGGFIYIAASDLIPELHKETDMKKVVSYFIFFLAGISFMYLTKLLAGG